MPRSDPINWKVDWFKVVDRDDDAPIIEPSDFDLIEAFGIETADEKNVIRILIDLKGGERLRFGLEPEKGDESPCQNQFS